MKFVVLLMADGDEKAWDQQTPEEQAAVMQRFGAFDEACAAREGVSILAGEALQDGDAAATVRTRDGQLSVTDGPFAEAVEQLGGFYLIEVPDRNVLVELLTELPAYDMQISPVVEGM
ncbi:YciI family protein [Ornithinimicrobium cryptoxanthini]|uniref:YciI family protein n=1 Tax=Ornithinimicrobium cryptoxanthini TaxID=2934161 RepID=A0ABY4YJE0_9MICO|nr:YciI family protein [Ornithinimicrobium cryptoxanthini]USQ76916.1 YciI family protein [Ornithinimicrobium cryptoxanthini]